MNKKHFYAAVVLLLFLAIGIQPAIAIDIPNSNPAIGTWNDDETIYTLADDFTEGLVIVQSNFTLDGAEHTVTGSGLDGISLLDIDFVTVKNVTVSGFTNGIHLTGSNNNTVMNTTTMDNQNGITIHLYSDYNTLSGNTVIDNYQGIRLSTAQHNVIKYNTIESNTLGIVLSGVPEFNQVYNNNFLANTQHTYVFSPLIDASYGNVFNLDLPIGGNYWQNHNANNPYELFYNDPPVNPITDYLPWGEPDGWPPPTPPTPEEAIEELIADVEELNAKEGILNSLDAKLQNALEALDAANAGQRQDAINKMEAFINAVEAQSGNQILVEDANALIASAEYIIGIL